LKKILFILIMLFFFTVFITADIYGQTPINKSPLNNAPPKVNENIPKEKPKPTVKSREFRNINLTATQISKSREFRNINLTATQISKSREFRNINLTATQISKSREFRNIDFIVTPFR